MPKPTPVLDAIHTRNLAALKRALDRKPTNQEILAASQRAWQQGLAFMLKQGADLNTSFRNYRPLHALIQEHPHNDPADNSDSRLACLQWLLDHGANPELTGAWPPARAILVAAYSGVPAAVDLLKKQVKIDAFVSAALGDVKAVRRALDKDPGFATARDGSTMSALHCAAASKVAPEPKLVEIAKLLLECGADPNAEAKGWSHDLAVIYFSATRHYTALTSVLLDYGADPAPGLSAALWSGDYEIAELCLARGADPNRTINEGRLLLNNLIRWGQIKPALWLLSKGASPNVADANGWTALHQSSTRGNSNLVEALLAAGADRKRKNNTGETPADLANKDNIAALLKPKKDPRTK
jgi:ankyrin repeat protein